MQTLNTLKLSSAGDGFPSFILAREVFAGLRGFCIGDNMKLCECGCGKEIIIKPHHRWSGIPRFIHGHNNKGKYGIRHVIMPKGEKHGNYKGGMPKCKTCGKLLGHYMSTYCQSCCCAREKNNNWQGGISYEPYTPDFNQQLKDRIRTRDNFICQLCGVPELECNRRLTIHHIDYNKKNYEDNNLISLCLICHNKTGINREHWTNYFYKLNNRGE